MQAPGRSVGLNLPLEKVNTASCSRERAALTVLIHITQSDIEKSVRAHSDEWVSPELLLQRVPAKTGCYREQICVYLKTNAKRCGSSLTAAAHIAAMSYPIVAGMQKRSVKNM